MFCPLYVSGQDRFLSVLTFWYHNRPKAVKVELHGSFLTFYQNGFLTNDFSADLDCFLRLCSWLVKTARQRSVVA